MDKRTARKRNGSLLGNASPSKNGGSAHEILPLYRTRITDTIPGFKPYTVYDDQGREIIEVKAESASAALKMAREDLIPYPKLKAMCAILKPCLPPPAS